MQPVNDDMEDLFRKAADSYPLNTSGANFDKVRQQADAETDMPEKKEPKRKYMWLLLLLLVPVPFLIKYYQATPTPQYSQNSKVSEATEQEKKNNLPTETPPNTDNNTNEKERSLTDKSRTSESVSNMPDQLKMQQAETLKVQKQSDNNTPINHTNKNIGKQAAIKSINKVSNHQNDLQSDAIVSKKNKRWQSGTESVFLSSGTKKINKNYPVLTGNNNKENEKLMNTKNAGVVKQSDTGTVKHLTDSASQTTASKKSTDSSTLSKVNKVSDSANSVILEKTAAAIKSKIKPAVYIGIITGLDFSAVKSTQIGGPGYNLGFIAGYKTGKHLAFETGIVWNYKRYYSGGKHVSTDKLDLLPHTELLYLNGTCDMIEIPVSVRYYFNAKAKNSWYAGAGISSYIMKKESYSYKSRRYNAEYYQKREYNSTSKNWLSVLQLNIGYEIDLKKAGSLRIEPYAKLPLQGIGIGKLPLTSVGVNFGFNLPVQ